MKAECMVWRASDATWMRFPRFAAQISAAEQDIPKELNFIPADTAAVVVHGAGSANSSA